MLKPHVAHLVVCNPRKNALLEAGCKSDRIDARKLNVKAYRPPRYAGPRACDFATGTFIPAYDFASARFLI